MNEINPSRQPVVRITDTGEAMADSRDVAAYFGKEHRRVLQTLRELQCSDDFRQHNFVPFKNKDLAGESTSHVLMTKDGFMFLVLGFTGGRAATFKERYIAQFNAMEAELRARSVDPMKALADPAALRGLLLTYSEKVLALEGEVSELRPQADALDRIAQSDGSLCITDAAKTLQVRPKDLFTFLRRNGWIYTRPGTAQEVAYQSRLVSDDLEHKTTTVTRADGSEKTVTQVRVTPRGLTKLAKLLPPVVTKVA